MKLKLSTVKAVGWACLVALLLAETLLLVDANNNEKDRGGEGGRRGGGGGGKNGRRRKNKERQRQQQQQQKQFQLSESDSFSSSLTDSEGSPSSSLSGSFLDSSPVIFADGSHHHGSSYSSPQHSSSSNDQQQFRSSFEESDTLGGHSDDTLSDQFHLHPHHPGHQLLPPPPPPTHTCEPIRIDICRNIGYNVTSMPNFVGHELQADGELQLNTFLPLINYGCSSQLKFFLCSVYVPMCTEKVPVTIGPCRPLCESVRGRCAPVLEELGFPWPEALNCSKFVPTNSVDQMCMDGPPPEYVDLAQPPPTIVAVDHSRTGGHHQQQHQQNPHMVNTGHKYQVVVNQQQKVPLLQGPTGGPAVQGHLPPPSSSHEVIISGSEERGGGGGGGSWNNYPANNQLTPAEESNGRRKQSGNRRNNRCQRLLKSEQYVFLESSFLLLLSSESSLSTSASTSASDHLQCVPKCGANILFSEENKQFVDYWTAIWAALALLSCALTLAAFFVAPSHSSSATSPVATAAMPLPSAVSAGKVVGHVPYQSANSSASASSFRYPERAVLYIAVCSGLSALAYLYRAAVGRQAVSCHLTELATTSAFTSGGESSAEDSSSSSSSSSASLAWLLVTSAAYNPHCTASFLLLYYFGMSAAAWFTVLSGTLSASLAFRLSLSQLSAHRTLYHCFAWCLPAAQTLAALVLRAVDGDELTGVCYVGGQSRRHLLVLVLLPSAAYLGLGVAMLLGALLFARFVLVVREGDQELCSCALAVSPEGGPFLEMTTTAATPMTQETASAEEQLHGGSSETARSEADCASGCGSFCRRFRRASASAAEDNHHPRHLQQLPPQHLRQQTTNSGGSGQSLLLPPPSQSHNQHFCGTVSSTSSYSTFSSSASSSSASGRHKAQSRGGGTSSLTTTATSRPPYNSLVDSSGRVLPPADFARSSSLRASSKRHPVNSRTPASVKHNSRRHYHLRRNLAASSSSSAVSKGSHQLFSTGKNLFPADKVSSSPSSSEFESETAAALIRSAIFALFYLIPAAFVTAGYAYEYLYRDSWLLKPETQFSSAVSSSASSSSSEVMQISSNSAVAATNAVGAESSATSTPNFEVFNMRLFMSLVIGINTGIWILTAKSPIKGWSWCSSSSSTSSTSSGCLFWRCFVKKGGPVPLSGSSVAGSVVSAAPASTISGGGGGGNVFGLAGPVALTGNHNSHFGGPQQLQQTTLPVYPTMMMSLHPYQQQQQLIQNSYQQQQQQAIGLLQQQQQQQQQHRRPLPETSQLSMSAASHQAAAFHHQQQQQQQFQQQQLTTGHLLHPSQHQHQHHLLFAGQQQPTAATANFAYHQQQQQQATEGNFFFLSDLAGANVAVAGPGSGSTATTDSTLLSSTVNSNGQQQQQQFFGVSSDQAAGVQSLWSAGASGAGGQQRAPGNETAV